MRSKNHLWLVSCCLAVLAIAVAGCPTSENVCKNVTCSGHGTCVAAEGAASCSCESGYVAQGLNCVEQPTTCEGVTCSDHGTCFINDDNLAECDCDPTYVADGLNCKKGDCALTGQTCSGDADCCGGMCLKYTGDLTGYCYERDCVGNASCVNHGDDDAEMCCVDVGGEYFICMKILEGYACGDQTGLCGESCAGQHDSACDPTQACLMAGVEDPNAVCAHECATDNDCDDCADPGDPGMEFTCQAISGGATYCLANDEAPCTSSQECQGEQVCIPWTSADGMGMEGTCNKLGDLPTGTECNEDDDPNDLPPSERCAGFYCIWNHCTEVCALENDCPENMVCTNAGFCMDANCDNVGYIGMCKYVAGSGDACDGDGDCPAGESCDYYLPPNGSVNKVCTTFVCDPADADCADVGEDCSVNQCYNGLCLTNQVDSWCAQLCEAHADCGEGMICGLLGVSDDQTTGACSPFDGSADPCTGDPSCPDGEVCTYNASPAGGIESICMTSLCDPADAGCAGVGGDCENTPCYNDLCLTNGVDTFCGAPCVTAEDCPSGYLCGGLTFQGDPNVYGTCVEAPGSGDPCQGDADCQTAGEACFYNQNPSGEIESLCLEQSCDPADANCGDIGDECGQGLPPCYNDLCLTGGGETWCSAPCVAHEDCPSGWLCGGLQFEGAPEAVGACVEATGSADPCDTEADCTDAAEACQLVAPPNAPIETLCLEGNAGGSATGAECGGDGMDPCFTDLCLVVSGQDSGYCSEICITNADCAGYDIGGVTLICGYFSTGDDYAAGCMEPGVNDPLCTLCLIDADCAGDAVCYTSATYPDESFCTMACPNGDECPDGSTCTDLGGGDMQCIPDSDSCVQ